MRSVSRLLKQSGQASSAHHGSATWSVCHQGQLQFVSEDGEEVVNIKEQVTPAEFCIYLCVFHCCVDVIIYYYYIILAHTKLMKRFIFLSSLDFFFK